MVLKVLDLFSGIGGFSLGLERAGMKTTAFCEIDPWCRKVLHKHWPGVLKFTDIRELRPKQGDYDLICGGFPCQDISFAGNRKGIINGKRSSLWKEYARLINEIRPKYAIIENVEHLRKNGLGVVLNDLARIGYDAEWAVITANSIGLPHQRKRLFIISYPRSERLNAHIREKRLLQINEERESKEIYTEGEQCESKPVEVRPILSKGSFDLRRDSYPNRFSAVSSVHRVTDGFPGKLDKIRRERIKMLGNSVVPQIVELMGREIIKNELEIGEK